MSNRTIPVTDQLYDYLVRVTVRESELLARLRSETRGMRGSGMQIAPEQGQFMTLLVELLGARRALEIGTYTGYSSLCVAAALPEDGKLIACDVSEEFTRVARRYWQEAKLSHKIELRLAPALSTLDALLADGSAESFDFAFIDADKEGYDAYYERCLRLLRRGGLIAVDNALWDGSVADPSRDDEDTRAIRALNQKVAGDARVTMSLVPIGDGLLLARKR
ncbi:MAG TPA: class I SAM-dependent methyltransferase [Polyangiaceae bacterium]